MNSFRVPGLVTIISLLVGGLVLDQTRPESLPPEAELISPAPVVAPTDARSSTWFCAAATATPDGLADGLVVLSNHTVSTKAAVVSVFRGGPEPIVDGLADEVVLDLPPQATVDLRLSDLAPGSPVVSIAVEIEGGGVMVDKVVSGPNGVARSSCATEGSADWVIASGATVPGARLQLIVFNPFPDDAVIDVDFVTEAGARTPEDLVALHVPSRSSRLIELGDVVAASDPVSTFVRARSGRVVAEAVQSFDGSADPLGLGVIGGVPAPAEMWAFPGVSPALGPARLVVVNPGDTLIRADVEVYPAGGDAERFVEPFELTLRPGQHGVVELRDEGRLAGIDSFTLIVRSFDGPRIVAGMEQRPLVEEPDALDELIEQPEAPSTGFAGSPGQPLVSTRLYTTVDLAEDDDRSALHIFNPADDSFVTIDVTIGVEDASRTVELEVGPQRTLRVPLSELATGRFSLSLDGSSPLIAAREVTGLSSRSWAPLLTEAGGA